MEELLRDYTPNLEVLNVAQWDAHSDKPILYYDVSVLWVAAAMNHLGIVKLLVEHGSEVNHTTRTNSTALRCACSNGNMEMLLYLMGKGGDVYIAKEHHDTNLSASIYSKRCDMVAYLVLELRFDVNECDPITGHDHQDIDQRIEARRIDATDQPDAREGAGDRDRHQRRCRQQVGRGELA